MVKQEKYEDEANFKQGGATVLKSVTGALKMPVDIRGSRGEILSELANRKTILKGWCPN